MQDYYFHADTEAQIVAVLNAAGLTAPDPGGKPRPIGEFAIQLLMTSSGFVELYDWGGTGENAIGALVRLYGFSDAFFYQGTSIKGAKIKSALGYNANNTSFSVNGSPYRSQTLSGLPSMQTVYVGCNDAGKSINGHLYHISVFPYFMSSSNLQLLTT